MQWRSQLHRDLPRANTNSIFQNFLPISILQFSTLNTLQLANCYLQHPDDSNRVLGRGLCRLQRYFRWSTAMLDVNESRPNFCARRAVEGLQSLSIALSPPVPISAYRKRIRLEGKKVRACVSSHVRAISHQARACSCS